MVLCASGYTVLPHLAVNQLTPQRRKLVRPFYDPVPTREVSLVYGRRVLKKRIIDALEVEIKRVIPEELSSLKRKAIQIVKINPDSHNT